MIGQNQISRGYNNILKKRDHSEAISHNIKTIIGREPNEGELSFIIKWHQTHLIENLISSLVKNSYRIKIAGVEVPIINTPFFWDRFFPSSFFCIIHNIIMNKRKIM